MWKDFLFQLQKNSLNICGHQTVNVSCILHDGAEKKRRECLGEKQ